MTNKQIFRKRKSTMTATRVRNVVENMAEHKQISALNTPSTNVSSSGSVINLSNNIIQGDDIINRSGNQIVLRTQTIHVRAVAVATSQTFRFIWFRDNFNAGTTPVVADVLNTANFMSEYNRTNLQQKRFTIVSDFKLNVNIAGEAIKTKERKHTTRSVAYYNGATAVAASNGRGATFLLVIGSDSTGTFDLSYRFEFLDM